MHPINSHLFAMAHEVERGSRHPRRGSRWAGYILGCQHHRRHRDRNSVGGRPSLGGDSSRPPWKHHEPVSTSRRGYYLKDVDGNTEYYRDELSAILIRSHIVMYASRRRLRPQPRQRDDSQRSSDDIITSIRPRASAPTVASQLQLRSILFMASTASFLVPSPLV